MNALFLNWDALFGYAYIAMLPRVVTCQEDQIPSLGRGDPGDSILAQPDMVPPPNPDVSGPLQRDGTSLRTLRRASSTWNLG